MSRILAVLSFVLGASVAQASDYQARLQFHVQRTGSEGRTGVGFWGIVPDITKQDPTKVFLVAGPLLKRPGGWVELMAGGFVDENGSVDPVLDVRANIHAGEWRVFLEGIRTFETRRTILLSNVTCPIARRVRLGGEVESHWTTTGHTLWGGPRMELVLDRERRGRVKLITAYQWSEDGQQLVRNYLVFNW